MEKQFKVELGFVQRVLPWIVAAGALVLYLLTLNHSATLGGLAKLAQVAGWDWRPALVTPLHFVLTYPIRWLPAGWQLVALNLLSAACASLALGLLARSVALLPHDRTRDQRQLERNDYSLLSIRAAWVPPVLAALVCGLQLSFWENAVVATGESFDLLIFAWLVHSLLQYRLDQNETRLSWFALVYGLSVTNNFAMIAFFPAFLSAMVWIKGASFFKLRFVLKMIALGGVGLLPYALLPAINSLTDPQGFGFWQLLSTHLGFQKSQLLGFPRYLIVLLSFTSILPVLFIGIRWPAQMGDVNPAGNALTMLMTHVIHGLFLVACVYVAFDPQFSPRNLSGGRFVMLPLYYLGALAIGYCAGYILLVFGSRSVPVPWPRPSAFRRAISPVLVALIWVGLVAVPAGLLVRNIPTILANTGPALGRLAVGLADSLPKKKAIVFSDDPFRLYALRWELGKKGLAQDFVLVDTASLSYPTYHRFLNKNFPQRWPRVPLDERLGQLVDSQTLASLMVLLGQREPLYYLHPSFGYYFEHFYQKPDRLIYELKTFPTNSISAPPMTAEEVRQQDAFWQSFKLKELDLLMGKVPPFTPPNKTNKNRKEIESMDANIARMYSVALNHFGVELQRAGDFKKAREYFDLALKLNDANPAAFVNREYNEQFQSGRRAGEKPSEGTTQRLSLYGGAWESLLSANGPIDEPSVCYLMAQVFLNARDTRQASQQLERVLSFTPDNQVVRLALIELCAQIPLPDKALEMIAAFRAQAGVNGLTEDQQVSLLTSEAWALAYKNELIAAEKLLRDTQEKFPRQTAPWAAQLQIYDRLGRVKEALTLLDQQVQLQPTNVTALVNYAYLLIQSQQFSNAIPFLDRALKLRPKMGQALLNRAIANLRSERLDAALADYRELEITTSPVSHEVYYGMGEVYFRKKSRNQAREYYEKYLKAAPAWLPERRFIEDRIKTLDAGTF